MFSNNENFNTSRNLNIMQKLYVEIFEIKCNYFFLYNLSINIHF